VENVVPWDGGIVAVNSFGVGGANGHCLMKSYTQQKKEQQVLEEELPRLVAVSARNESAINYMINRVIILLFALAIFYYSILYLVTIGIHFKIQDVFMVLVFINNLHI